MAPARQRFGLLGGGVSTGLPSGYLAAEFLESTGTQYIDTGILFSTAMRLHADVEPLNYPPSDAYIIFGSDAISSSNKNFLYFRALGNDSRWIFTVGVGGKYSSTILGVNKELKRFVIDYDGKAHVLTCDGVTHNTFNGEGELPTTLTLFALHRLWYDDPNNISFASSGKKRVYYFTVEDGDKACNFIPALDSIGTPCMFDKVTRKPFYNSGKGTFIVGMDMKQARKLGKLPAGGGELTVSLPWEALDDAKVQAALAKAAENGWTIIEQYREPEEATENIAVDFLGGTGEQYIDSNFVPTQETAVRSVAQFTYTGAVFAGLQSRYSSGVSFIDVSGTVYWRFFGISGTWERDYTKNEIVLSKKGLVINGEQQEQSGALGSYNVPSIAIFASKWASDGSYNNNGQVRLFEFEISENNEIILYLVPVIDAQGVPCLFDTVSEQPFYNSGSGAFIVGFETVEAARRLAKLPKVEAGELTVSLPAAARDAASMVPTALSIAASRGWTIIEQYRA